MKSSQTNFKEKKIILVMTCILTILTIIFVFLNKNTLTNYGDEKIDGTILFIYGEQQDYVDFEYIEKLPQTEFEATVRSSGQSPKEVMYTAVKMSDILNSLGIDYKSTNRAIIRAEDAYASAVSAEDIDIDDNVYIAYKIDDKYMQSRENGGEGPFQLVIRQDNFSQRWVKYVVEVEIE